MGANISAGDFGCCGMWHQGCAIGMGCIYGKFAEDETEATQLLMYAMQHCNVFDMLYLKKDVDFTKEWKESVALIGTPFKQLHMTSTEVNDNANNVIREAEELLRKLGL